MTIKEALKTANDKLKLCNSPSAYLDAEVLLMHVMKLRSTKVDKSWMYTHNESHLTKKEEKFFFKLVARRCKHEPIAYIVKKKEFYGYDFHVDKNVLIPRPETEIIVSEVLDLIKNRKSTEKKFDIVDIGTGSGCIVISILNELAKFNETKLIQSAIANDISKKAIAVAKQNSRKYGLSKKIKHIRSDFKNIFKKRMLENSVPLIIVANLPYIKKGLYNKLPSSVKFEPRSALVGGKDGLKHINNLLKCTSLMQKSGNRPISVFIESDPDQINPIKHLAKKLLPSSDSFTIKDLRGKKRFVKIEMYY